VSGPNQDFAKEILNMENVCDVILMTCFRRRHQNDVTFYFLEVLLRHNQFAGPQISQIMQIQITETQKFKTVQYFCNYNFFMNLKAKKIRN